jgi:threonine synthase
VLLLITGSGLKDIESARKAISKAYKIAPDMDELKKIINSIFK